MDNNKLYKIKNRSASVVVYKIPEAGIRREFAPGESKMISYSELTQLTYQPGGKELMSDFLQLEDEEAIAEFNIEAEPEYYMSEEQVADLIMNGSMEAFLDCLDYAPTGIIDLIKRFAVSIPMSDRNKAEALKEKTGFDLEAALKNMKAEKESEAEAAADNGTAKSTASNGKRRTSANYKVVGTTTNTTAAKPNYKVVTK